MGACCFCACIFKMILGILNMILMLFGVIIACLGGIVLAMSDSSFIKELVRVIVVPVLDNLFGTSFIAQSATGDLKDLLAPVAWALIIIGCILVGIALFGYIGLSLSINICLAIYAFLIGAIILVQIVLVALFYSGKLNAPIEKLMVTTIHQKYQGINSSDIYSLSWNLVMLRFECCGATNFRDFQIGMQQTTNWPKNETVKIKDQTYADVFDFPMVCCNTTGDFPKVEFTDKNCIKETSASNNKDKGCWQAIASEIQAEKTKSLIFYIIALIIQVVILFMVIIVMQENKVFPNSS